MSEDAQQQQSEQDIINGLLTPDEVADAFGSGGEDALRRARIEKAFPIFGERAVELVYGGRPATPTPGRPAEQAPIHQDEEPRSDARTYAPAGEREEPGPERLSGDRVPTLPGDENKSISVAHAGHIPFKDFMLAGKSPGLSLSGAAVQPLRPYFNEETRQFENPLRFFETGEGAPAIGYGFTINQAVASEHGYGRGLAAVVYAGEGLTPELAVRLMDPIHDGVSEGWVPSEKGMPEPLGDNPQPTDLAAVKGCQEGQRQRVYDRLANPEVTNQLVAMLSAALENPTEKPNGQQRLYLRGVKPQNAHAILYGMLDMFSTSPSLRAAVGGKWTFATEVGEHGNYDGNSGLRFMFSSFIPSQSNRPQDAGINGVVRRQPNPDSIYTKAATKLATTFLNGHDPEEVARLASAAGRIDPRHPEAWCESLLAA